MHSNSSLYQNHTTSTPKLWFWPEKAALIASTCIKLRDLEASTVDFYMHFLPALPSLSLNELAASEIGHLPIKINGYLLSMTESISALEGLAASSGREVVFGVDIYAGAEYFIITPQGAITHNSLLSLTKYSLAALRFISFAFLGFAVVKPFYMHSDEILYGEDPSHALKQASSEAIYNLLWLGVPLLITAPLDPFLALPVSIGLLAITFVIPNETMEAFRQTVTNTIFEGVEILSQAGFSFLELMAKGPAPGEAEGEAWKALIKEVDKVVFEGVEILSQAVSSFLEVIEGKTINGESEEQGWEY